MQKTIVITARQNDLKLDKLLISLYPDFNFADLYRFIRKKEITVNGLKVATNYRVKTGDRVEFSAFLEKIMSHPDRVKEKQKINSPYLDVLKNTIVYEDKDLLVLNKPYGLAAQGGSGVAVSVADLVGEIYRGAKLVHRLDRDTTGLLLVAKNLETANVLTDMFRKRKGITKKYLAVARGKFSQNSGKINYRLTKKMDNSGEKVYRDDSRGKEAISLYKVLDYCPDYDISLVEVEILTGRTHQIRVHLKEIGHPLVGDFKYGYRSAIDDRFSGEQRGIDNELKAAFSKLQLHSHKMSLSLYKKTINLMAPPPSHMEQVLQLFKS